MSLLNSKNDYQRRASLANITTAVSTRALDASWQVPHGELFPKLCPLVVDVSNGVRAKLPDLLRKLSPNDVSAHIDELLPYIRLGLTNMAADIASSASDVLMMVLEIGPYDLVECAGGWVKTLTTLLAALKWGAPTEIEVRNKGWMPANLISEGKISLKLMNVLAAFLRIGLSERPVADERVNARTWPFPLCNTEAHMLPKRPNAFAHLNLFGPPRDEASTMYVEREQRQRIFHRRYRASVEGGAYAAKLQEGEVGRAAASVGIVVKDGMEGFELDA